MVNEIFCVIEAINKVSGISKWLILFRIFLDIHLASPFLHFHHTYHQGCAKWISKPI